MKLKEKTVKKINFQFLKEYFKSDQTEVTNEKMIRCK